MKAVIFDLNEAILADEGMIDGLKKLLDELSFNHIPMAFITNAQKSSFDPVIDNSHIRGYFSVIFTAEDREMGKPDFEIYLKTANYLHVEPEDCLVFVDSLSGVRAAKVARMKVIGVATTYTKKELSLADTIVENFMNVNLEFLNKV